MVSPANHQQNNFTLDTRSKKSGYLFYTLLAVAVITGMYFLSRYNYPFFHSLTDGITVLIATGVFILVWNRRHLLDNHYYLFIGIAFLFFAFWDFMHLLGNKDMGVFPQYGNLGPTFYIVSRYFLAISMLVAPLFIKRKLNTVMMIVIYSIISLLLLLSILYWRNFPVTYIDGIGLTPFKVTSDYIICAILLAAIIFLVLNRRSVDARVFRLVIYSFVLFIATGLAFTAYTDPFGATNALGHFFQIVSFYLVYSAFINTLFIKPQDILYRNLQQSKNEATKLNSELEQSNLNLKQDIIRREQAEKALKESERKLIDVLESMPDAFVSLDAGLRYTYVNVNAERLQVARREELLGRDIRSVYPDAESYKTIKLYEQVIREQKPITSTTYHAGFERWIEVRAFPTPDGVSVFYKDVSAQVKAEQSLKESEERFRAIAETSLVLISVSRLEDGEILFANRAHSEAFGYPVNESIGHKGFDMWADPKERDKLIKTITEQGSVMDYEIKVKKADGTLFWISTSVRPIHYAGQSALLGTSIDITKRKKDEEEIAHLASFPRLNPNPIIEMDLSENISYANPAAVKHFPDLLKLGDKHPFLAGIVDIVKKGDRRPVTSDVKVGNSWYERTVAYVSSSQTYRLYVRDITTRKETEEELRHRTDDLEASNKELEAFSYSVSHDLRAPLRSMEGFSDALLEDYSGKLDDQGKKYLKYIQESSDLMGRLIDDLLKLSRVTRSDINFDTVDLSELACMVIDELKKVNPEREVSVNISPGLEAYGDRNLLRVVLENLLGNAWKFSSKAETPGIEMGITRYNGKNAYFIHDNGVGFDMAYIDKLFKPFQRLHKESEFPGTGIGLATVYRIIRRHGGEVWAESKQGEGATFYFTLA